MKIFWYSPYEGVQSQQQVRDSITRSIFLAPAYFYIKTAYEELGEDTPIQWTIPIFDFIDELELRLLAEDSKLFCISIYPWNIEKLKVLTSKLASEGFFDGKFLLVGGPGCDDFLLTHKHLVDYACFGDGEQGFIDIIRDITGKSRLNPISSVNIAYRRGDKFIRTQSAFIKRKHKESPWVKQKTLIAKVLDHYTTKYESVAFVAPWETGRGCPYKCTFCDWTKSQSSGNKVFKFQHTLTDDLDTFHELGITHLLLADANFGLWDSDLDLIDYMCKLKNEKGSKLGIFNTNLSKNKKHNIKKMFEKLIVNKIPLVFKFSVQDTHKEVLDAIRRPDITWEAHRQMLLDFKRLIRLGGDKSDPPFMVEIILGLPNQTFDSWAETVFDIIGPGFAPRMYLLHDIANAPIALDIEYRNEWQIKSKTLRFEEGSTYTPKIVVSTKTYSEDDWADMLALSKVVQNLMLLRSKEIIFASGRQLVDAAKEIVMMPAVKYSSSKLAKRLKSDEEFADVSEENMRQTVATFGAIREHYGFDDEMRKQIYELFFGTAAGQGGGLLAF